MAAEITEDLMLNRFGDYKIGGTLTVDQRFKIEFKPLVAAGEFSGRHIVASVQVKADIPEFMSPILVKKHVFRGR